MHLLLLHLQLCVCLLPVLQPLTAIEVKKLAVDDLKTTIACTQNDIQELTKRLTGLETVRVCLSVLLSLEFDE